MSAERLSEECRAAHESYKASWPGHLVPPAEVRDAMHDSMDYPDYVVVDRMLRAPIAALCPRCGGRGWFYDGLLGDRFCHHPDALTIGDALAEWSVWRHEMTEISVRLRFALHDEGCPAAHEYVDEDGHGYLPDCSCGLERLRAVLNNPCNRRKGDRL